MLGYGSRGKGQHKQVKIFGPFALTPASVQVIVTRTSPGVGLLCGGDGSVELVIRSDHDVAEVLLQWVHRYVYFYFCYSFNGTQAQRMQKRVAVHLGFVGERIIGGDSLRLAKIIKLAQTKSKAPTESLSV